MNEEEKKLEEERNGVKEDFGKPVGIYELEVIDKETGNVLETRRVKNLVVNSGKTAIRDGLAGNGMWWGDYWKGVKIGKNGTAPTVNDTDLTEFYRSVTGSNSWDDVNKRRVVEALFTDFTETVNICEAGLFWHTEPYWGAMFSRVTFASLELSPTKHLKVKIYIIP